MTRAVFQYCVILLQGEGERVRRVYEVQETHQCPAIRSQPDSKQTLHTLVVANYQQSQCKFFTK